MVRGYALHFVRLTILLCLCMFSIDLSAQQVHSVADVLAIKNATPTYKSNLDFLSKVKGISIIDGYQFRTETDEMELENQQFQFRFKFNSKDERKAYDRILATQKKIYNALDEEIILDDISKKYRYLTDYIFLKEEAQIIDQKLIILKDKKVVLRKLLDVQTEVDVKGWLSNEEDIMEMKADSLKNANERQLLIYSLLGEYHLEDEIGTGNLISLEKILETVNEIDQTGTLNPSYRVAAMEELYARSEFSFEDAQAKKWLDFAQIQYQSDNKVSFQKELSFGTSINLPSKSNNRIKKNDVALEVLEKKLQKEEEYQKITSEILEDKARLLTKYGELGQMQSLIEDQKLNETYESLLSLANVSPLTLLDIQNSILKNNSKLLKLRKEIFEIYLEIISDSAVILQQPRKNYLSDALEIY